MTKKSVLAEKFVLGGLLFSLGALGASGFILYKAKQLALQNPQTYNNLPANNSSIIPQPPFDWKTYSTDEYSIRYPQSMDISLKNRCCDFVIYFPESAVKTTLPAFSRAQVGMFSSADAEWTEDCQTSYKLAESHDSVERAGSVKINGVEFNKAIANKAYYQELYSSLYNGKCYQFSLYLYPAGFVEETPDQTTESDREEGFIKLRQILNTFKVSA